MAAQYQLRSQGPLSGPALLEEMTSEHRKRLATILATVNTTSPADDERSPKQLTYFHRHHAFCQQGVPIYSETAILKACHELQPRNYPLPNELLVASVGEETSRSGSGCSAAAPDATTPLRPASPEPRALMIRIPSLDLEVEVNGGSMREIHNELVEILSVSAMSQLKLFFVPAQPGAMRVLVVKEQAFQQYLQTPGHFEYAGLAPVTLHQRGRSSLTSAWNRAHTSQPPESTSSPLR